MPSIVIIVPELLPVPPLQGGAIEHWVDEVSGYLSTPDNQVTIVSRPAGVAGRDGISYVGIPWTPVERFFNRLKDRVTWKNPLRYLAKIQNVYSYGQRVAREAVNHDIIYLHNEPNILLFLKKRSDQKIVLHMHNDHLCMRFFRPFYRKALAKADQVICVSDYIRRQAIRSFPEYADRFVVVFNATDPNVFKPYGDEANKQLESVLKADPKHKYLLYVGRLSPVKGVHVLIEAFREVHRTMPNVHLIITGSSFFGDAAKTAYEQQLVDLAEPINDAIIFTGYLAHHQLKFLYSLVDMIAIPSVWQDPCPLVVLEAMASGTCLVASAVGGIPEVVENGVDGMLVQPSDAQELSRVIANTLSDAPLMHRIETNAREKIKRNYTWVRLITELNTVLGTLK